MLALPSPPGPQNPLCGLLSTSIRTTFNRPSRTEKQFIFDGFAVKRYFYNFAPKDQYHEKHIPPISHIPSQQNINPTFQIHLQGLPSLEDVTLPPDSWIYDEIEPAEDDEVLEVDNRKYVRLTPANASRYESRFGCRLLLSRD